MNSIATGIMGMLLGIFLLSSSAHSLVFEIPMGDPTIITDTYISNQRGVLDRTGLDSNYGDANSLWLHCNPNSTRFASNRALIKLDLNSLPQGQPLLGAFLSLYDYQHTAFTVNVFEKISVHEMLSDWDLNATILTKNGTDAWASRGGDFNSTELDYVPLGMPNEWKSWDVTNTISSYLSSGTNYGWIVRGKTDSISGSCTGHDLKFYSSRHSDPAFRPKLTLVFGSSQSELDSVKQNLGIIDKAQKIADRQLNELRAIKIISSQIPVEQPNSGFAPESGIYIFQPNWYASNSFLDLGTTWPMPQDLLQGFGVDPLPDQSTALMVFSGIIANRSVKIPLAISAGLAPIFSHSNYSAVLGQGPVVDSTDPNYYLIEKISDYHYRFFFDDGFHYEGVAPPEASLYEKLPYYNDGSFDFYALPGQATDMDGFCSPDETIDSSPVDCFYVKMVLRSQMPKIVSGIIAELSSLPPRWESIPGQEVTQGNPFSQIDLWNYALGPTGNPADLAYSITGQTNPDLTNCALASNRYLDCTTPITSGGSTITVQASNPNGFDQTSFDLQSLALPNDPPYWNAIPNQSVTIGSPFSQIDLWNYAGDAQDLPSAMLYEIISQTNPGLTNCAIDSNRYVNCTVPSTTGDSNVVVRVIDTGSLSADTNFLLTSNPIPNFSPEALDVNVSPSSPIDSNDLYCNYTYFDAESDPESGTTFSWYENSLELSGQSSQILSNSLTVIGSQYYCKVFPQASSGTQNYQWFQSANTVTVLADPVHDISLSNLSFSTDPLWINYSNGISVLVSNVGNRDETVTLRFKVDSIEQSTQTFALAADTNEIRTFYWNPSVPSTTVPYNIKLSADMVPEETNIADNEVNADINVLDSTDGSKFIIGGQPPGTVPEQTPFDVNAKIWNNTSQPMYNIPVTISVEPGSSFLINEPATKIIPVIAPNSTYVVPWNISSTSQIGWQYFRVTSINSTEVDNFYVKSYADVIGVGGLAPNTPINTPFIATGRVGNGSDVPLHNVLVTISIVGDLTFQDTNYTKIIPTISPHSYSDATWNLKTNGSTGFQEFDVNSFGIVDIGYVYVTSSLAPRNLPFSNAKLKVLSNA